MDVKDTTESERDRIVADYIARKMRGCVKIIRVDNFDREHVPDELIAENVDPKIATEITEFLNRKHSGIYSPDFYKVVPDDHKLHQYPEG